MWSLEPRASSLERSASRVERRAPSRQPREPVSAAAPLAPALSPSRPPLRTQLSRGTLGKAPRLLLSELGPSSLATDRPTTARPNPQTLNARWLSSPPALRPPGAQTLPRSQFSTPPQASPQAQREHPVLQPRTPPTPTALLFFLPFLEGQGLGPQDHPGHTQSPGPGARTDSLTHRDPHTGAQRPGGLGLDGRASLAEELQWASEPSGIHRLAPGPTGPPLCSLLCWVYPGEARPRDLGPRMPSYYRPAFSCFSLLLRSLRVLTRCCHWAWQEARCLQPAGISLLPDGRSLGTESCGSTGRGRFLRCCC